MTTRLLGRGAARLRAPSLFVVALLLTTLIGVTAPSAEGAAQTTELVVVNGPSDGSGLRATLKGPTLKIKNTTGKWVYGVAGMADGSLRGVGGADNDPRYHCGVIPPPYVPTPGNFICAF